MAMKKTQFLALCFVMVLLCPCLAAADEPDQIQPQATAMASLELSEAELNFIREHPIIHLGVDPEFIPYSFIDSDGVYKGISADYQAQIIAATGLTFDIARGMTWSQAYERAVEKQLDVLPCVSKTSQREQYFLFSDPYFDFQRVIYVNTDNKEINTFEDLYGKTVAVQEDTSNHSFLIDYPEIKLDLFDSVESALLAVSNGTDAAFVGNLATSNYQAKANGITNLRYVPIGSQEPQSLYFAVRKDWPELVSIINKALGAISEESKLAISDKWVSVETNADYSGILRIAGIVGGLTLLIMLVSFFWILRLRKEIVIRKQTQLDLETAKRVADDANQSKSLFLARMSHEIRTPLNGITGMSYLLKKTSLSLTQRMYLDKIIHSSANMLGIINDILDFSKIESGKVELEIASFSLDQTVQDVVNVVSYKIEEKEIGFIFTKDPAVPNWFFGDAKRLGQILINLLNNSSKFTSTGSVSLDIRLLAKENDQYHLSFTIRDTGIGMTDEQVKKLFVPYMQADVSINRRFGGTGLGLSIVKNLVDLMGGEVNVFSTIGEGSSFIVNLTLPVDVEKEKESRAIVPTELFKNMKALVLDKAGTGMNMIRKYLESFGMSCEMTTSPRSAASMLEAANGKTTSPFDLLIVDYETPSVGGFQYAEGISGDTQITHKPKILMLLPMMREDLFDQYSEHGVDIAVGKPVVPSILLNAILDVFHLKAVAEAQTSDSETAALDVSRCVLVAEDNKTNQFIAKSLLDQIGAEVILVGNGQEAVEYYTQHKEHIDLILMDLHMPVMNGYEATEAIRKISADVPIIAMTADVVMGVQEKCEKCGIHTYISKPFDPERFIRTIRDFLLTIKPKPRVEQPAETSTEQPAEQPAETSTEQSAEPSTEQPAEQPVEPSAEQPAEPSADTPALDVEKGIRELGLGRELYLQVLAEYRNENLDTADRMTLAVREGRYADAAGIAHKVKSSSGSIGAKALHELSVRLQATLEKADGPGASVLSEEFARSISRVLDEIQKLLNAPA
jgi:two-component system, sensor histidine kinase and response regulator